MPDHNRQCGSCGRSNVLANDEDEEVWCLHCGWTSGPDTHQNTRATEATD